jgi:hypothetical protein
MSELPNRSSGDSATTVQISPPDIVRRRVTAWGGVPSQTSSLDTYKRFKPSGNGSAMTNDNSSARDWTDAFARRTADGFAEAFAENDVLEATTLVNPLQGPREG